MGELKSLAQESSRWKPGDASDPFPTFLVRASVTWVTLRSVGNRANVGLDFGAECADV